MTNNERVAQTLQSAHDMFEAIQGEHEKCGFDGIMEELVAISPDFLLSNSERDHIMLRILNSIGTILGDEYLKLAAKIRVSNEVHERRN